MKKAKKTATKRVRKLTTVEQNAKAFSMLYTLIQAVREKYSRDPTSHGVVLSEVGPSGSIYASVVRYHARFAEQKEVIVSVKTTTLSEAVRLLSRRWLVSGKANERLHSMVDSKETDGGWSGLEPEFNT